MTEIKNFQSELGEKMTSEQIAKANRMVWVWQANHQHIRHQ